MTKPPSAARRWFVTRLLLALVTAPLAVEAQSPGKVFRIGYVSPASPPQGASPSWTAFLEACDSKGFIEGTNMIVERRYASGGGPPRAQELLRDLVALNVDVIVTVSTMVALEAKKMIKQLPIIRPWRPT